MTNKEKLHASM